MRMRNPGSEEEDISGEGMYGGGKGKLRIHETAKREVMARLFFPARRDGLGLSRRFMCHVCLGLFSLRVAPFFAALYHGKGIYFCLYVFVLSRKLRVYRYVFLV